jgi:hypothetical protein
MSLYWGIRAVVLFEKSRGFWWQSYQFIFNFIGSFGGWCCLYVLLIRVQNFKGEFQSVSGGDIFLFLVSLLGLTGHLPQSVYGTVESFSKIAEKATDKLIK